MLLGGGGIDVKHNDSPPDVQFEKESYLSDVISIYTADVEDLELKNPEDLFSYIYFQLIEILNEELKTRKSFKIQFVMTTLFSKLNPETNELELTEIPPNFRSFMHTILNESMIYKLIEIVSNKLSTDHEFFNQTKSGWNVEKILSLELKVVQYRPLKAFGGTYLQTPLLLQWKERSGGIDKNDPNRSTHSREVRHYKYPEIMSKVNFSGVEFPMNFKNFDNIMTKFHAQNQDIALTIIAYHESPDFAKNVKHQKIVLLNSSPFRMHMERQNRIIRNCFPYYMYQGEKRKIEVDLLLVISPDYSTSHFILIRNLVSFLRRNKHTNLICRMCLSHFHSSSSLDQHMLYCTKKSAVTRFPTNPNIVFENYKLTQKLPFIYYMDCESYLKPDSETKSAYRIIHQHLPCAYSYICIDWLGNKAGGNTYVQKYPNENIIKLFLDELMDDVSQKIDLLIQYQKTAYKTMNTSNINLKDVLRNKCDKFKKCGFCDKLFTRDDYENGRLAAHHSHLPPFKFEHLSCNKHNIAAKLPFQFNVFIHNGSNYDFNFIIQNLHLMGVENIDIIPKSSQKFLCIICNIKKGEYSAQIRFVDSYQFLSTSLANLVESVYEEGKGFDKFKLVYDEFSTEISRGLRPDDLFHKSMFPYNLLDGFKSLERKDFHSSKYYYNDLKETPPNPADLDRARKLWKFLEIHDLRGLVYFYCKLDTLILSCVFEAFRNVLLQTFKLDPGWFISLPGFSYSSAIRSVKCKLEFITSPTMYEFVLKSKRGGYAGIGSLKYCESNNKYLPDKLFNPALPTSFIQSLDVCALYAYSMKQCLPDRSFRFLPKEEMEEILSHDIHLFIGRLDVNSEIGYLLEVSLEIPSHLHPFLDDLPPVYENKKIAKEMLSDIQLDFIDSLQTNSQIFNSTRLIADLLPKKNYIVHSRLLKLYVELGVRITGVRNVLEFHQSPFLCAFIDRAIELRKKAKSTFESDIMKKISNSTYGRSLLQKEQQKSVKLVKSDDKILFYSSQPLFDDLHPINDALVAVVMKKRSVVLDSPVIWGCSILDIAKERFLRYYYMVLKPAFPELSLICTDTDSLSVYIEGSETDFYDFLWEKRHEHDLSGIDKNDPMFGKYFDDTNKSVPAPSGSGKTEYATSLIEKSDFLFQSKFSKIIVVCAHYQEAYRKLQSKLKCVFVNSLEDIEKHLVPHACILVDDQLNALENPQTASDESSSGGSVSEVSRIYEPADEI
ncbi:putative DNA polymerase [Orchesella cincta]|uniref:Putative DNA polymerase n=1 Tax=Orchesella cincta TaxID=48709 RepID=A0A1D2M720_ORCCI|nr:putative DNA polymerase [Orchesella cincta]